MPLPILVHSLNNSGERAGGAFDCPNKLERDRNVPLFLVHLKAEQFIIKNKNIKQERGKKIISFINLFMLQVDHLNAASTDRMTY